MMPRHSVQHVSWAVTVSVAGGCRVAAVGLSRRPPWPGTVVLADESPLQNATLVSDKCCGHRRRPPESLRGPPPRSRATVTVTVRPAHDASTGS